MRCIVIQYFILFIVKNGNKNLFLHSTIQSCGVHVSINDVYLNLIFLLLKIDISPVWQQSMGVHHRREHNGLWTKVFAAQTQRVEYFSE